MQKENNYYNVLNDLADLVQDHIMQLRQAFNQPISPITSSAIDEAYTQYMSYANQEREEQFESSNDSDEAYSFYEAYNHRDNAQNKKSKEKQIELA
jgi:hypothetical protein